MLAASSSVRSSGRGLSLVAGTSSPEPSTVLVSGLSPSPPFSAFFFLRHVWMRKPAPPSSTAAPPAIHFQFQRVSSFAVLVASRYWSGISLATQPPFIPVTSSISRIAMRSRPQFSSHLSRLRGTA